MDVPPDETLALADQEITRLASDPSPEARSRRAKALIAKAAALAPLGRPEEELAAYDEVIYRYAQDPDQVIIQCVARAFLNSGIALWAAGRHDDAIARFDGAARFRPAREPDIRAVVARAVTTKARALYTLERFEQALPSAGQVIDDYADDPDPRLRTQVIQAYSIQAAALGELGRREEQIQSHLQMYQRYQDLEDDEVREQVVVSMALMIIAMAEAGDHGGALNAFNRILNDYGSDKNPAIASTLTVADRAIRHSVEADQRKHEPPATTSAPARRGIGDVDTARIDALAREADGGDRLEALTALWKATFELEQWWFVLRGDLENPRPFVGVYDGRPFVLAFTTAERVHEFAVANGYAPADDSTYSITMTPDATVDAAVAWAAQGIHAITFDHGTTGYYAPLANLEAIRAHVRGG